MKSKAWFGYGSREAWYKAKPFWLVITAPDQKEPMILRYKTEKLQAEGYSTFKKLLKPGGTISKDFYKKGRTNAA